MQSLLHNGSECMVWKTESFCALDKWSETTRNPLASSSSNGVILQGGSAPTPEGGGGVTTLQVLHSTIVACFYDGNGWQNPDTCAWYMSSQNVSWKHKVSKLQVPMLQEDASGGGGGGGLGVFTLQLVAVTLSLTPKAVCCHWPNFSYQL